jgi:metallo-beta-lactamase family protein
MVGLTFHGRPMRDRFCARAAHPIDCGVQAQDAQGPELRTFSFDARRRRPADPCAHRSFRSLPKLPGQATDEVYATAGARELCAVMLGRGRHPGKRGPPALVSATKPGRPRVAHLHGTRCALTLDLFETVKLGEEVAVARGSRLSTEAAMPRLGLHRGGSRPPRAPADFLATRRGWLGPSADPDGPAGVDHVVLESTYDPATADTDPVETPATGPGTSGCARRGRTC